MRTATLLVLAAALAAAQDDPREAAYAKLDSAIAWLHDGVVLPDAEALGRRRSKAERDPSSLVEEALERAGKEKRLVLWYVPRQPGSHMNRAAILDAYLKAAVFSDPDLAAFVNRSFVPLRCVATAAVAGERGLRRFAFVEPGIVFLAPDGETVHVADRLRTYSPDWFLALFRSVLDSRPEFKPAAPPAPAGALERAVEARLRRDGKAALALLEGLAEPEAQVEKGRVLMHLGRFDEAREVLGRAADVASARQAEANYWAGLLERIGGRGPGTERWARVVKDFPGTPWAAKAAANLVVREDSLPMGPAMHAFEEVAWPPEEALAGRPSSTRWARTPADLPDVARRAVEWLLRNQDASGAWTDSRYVYCDSPKILPNVHMAATALAAAALLAWRDVAPERVDAALAKVTAWVLDEKRMARKQNEEAFADAYRLLYLARRHRTLEGKAKEENLAALDRIALALAKQQRATGLFWHEYENPFVTAAAVLGLDAAKGAGLEPNPAVLARAADALLKCRSKDGRYTYGGPQARPSVAKDTCARAPAAEAALLAAGRGSKEDVAAALDRFLEYLPRLEAVRTCDFHADAELGGFFFFFGFFHASEAANRLDGEARDRVAGKLLAHLVSIPEWDGSFLDSHELGKGYGTAMALLSLAELKPRPKIY